MNVLKGLIRERNFYLTGFSLALIFSLLLGINQGINLHTTFIIEDTSSKIDSDIKIQFRTSNYLDEYEDLITFLEDYPKITYLQSLSIKTDNLYIRHEENWSESIQECSLYGTNLTKYISNQRNIDEFNFLQKNISTHLNSDEIIISHHLANKLTLNLGDSLDILYNDTLSGLTNQIYELKIVGIIEKNYTSRPVEFYEGPSNVNQIIELGKIFSFKTDFFIIFNLETVRDLLSPIIGEQMKSFELISIFIEKEIEMPKLNQFLSQMSNLDSELRNFVFRNNPVSGPDLMTMTNFIAMFLVSVEDNVGHYKFLIFLNLMPLYIFAFILLYNLRDSAIFSNFENYQLLSKRGFKKMDIIFNFSKESCIIGIFGSLLSLLLSELFLNLFISNVLKVQYQFSTIGFFKRHLDSYQSILLMMFIGIMIIFYASTSCFIKYKKKKNLLFGNEKRKINLGMLFLGGIYPLLYYIIINFDLFEKYEFLNDINLDFLMQFSVAFSLLVLVYSFSSLFGRKIISIFEKIYSKIFRRSESMEFSQSLYNYKNSSTTISIIFILLFSSSYLVMATTINNNYNEYLNDIVFRKVGGDLQYSTLIQNEYNATLNSSIYQFSSEQNFHATEMIWLDSYQYNSSKEYHSISVCGISPNEYTSILTEEIGNSSLFQTMEQNSSYAVIDEADHLKYNVNIGDSINIFKENTSINILIIGIVNIIPTVSKDGSFDIILNKNNSIFHSEFEKNDRFLFLQYIFTSSASNLNIDGFRKKFEQEFSFIDWHFLSQDSMIKNMQNPCLIFGIVPSSMMFFNLESIIIMIISLIGIISLLKIKFEKESENLALIVVRGYSKWSIIKNNFIFQSLLALSALIFTPIAFISSFFFFFYYNHTYFHQIFQFILNPLVLIGKLMGFIIPYLMVIFIVEYYFIKKLTSVHNLSYFLKKK
ncbi:MAG: FtsX-like permease family protein [Promethearchaeota archaeon]